MTEKLEIFLVTFWFKRLERYSRSWSWIEVWQHIIKSILLPCISCQAHMAITQVLCLSALSIYVSNGASLNRKLIWLCQEFRIQSFCWFFRCSKLHTTIFNLQKQSSQIKTYNSLNYYLCRDYKCANTRRHVTERHSRMEIFLQTNLRHWQHW